MTGMTGLPAILDQPEAAVRTKGSVIPFGFVGHEDHLGEIVPRFDAKSNINTNEEHAVYMTEKTGDGKICTKEGSV